MIGRSIVLVLLILILSAGGIIWFDYLNVIDAKTVLAPYYKYLPSFIPGVGRTQPVIPEDELINIDRERLAILVEHMDLRSLEMDARQQDLDDQYGLIMQMAQELEQQKKELEEIEISINARIADAENKDSNVEQNARYLTGMPPQNAVGIIAALDDQDAIDVIRKTEEIARAEGTTSIVSFWFSLMEPARAAELQRKMAGRPGSL
jgi:flagellar protein FlbB